MMIFWLYSWKKENLYEVFFLISLLRIRKNAVVIFLIFLCLCKLGIIFTRFHTFYVMQEKTGLLKFFYKCCGTLIWVRIGAC